MVDIPDDLYLKGSLYMAYRLSGQNMKATYWEKDCPKAARNIWVIVLHWLILSIFPVDILSVTIMKTTQ